MLQALIKKGKVVGETVPAPMVSDGAVLVKVINSCISAGTEISGVQASSKSLIKRALEQPENVRKVFDMVKSEGVAKAYAKVKGKLETGNPTGYSVSGVVIGVGKGVLDFKIGDRVAAAGAGIANHAEYVDVPVNLVMKMPQEMDFISASTVALGGIAMQGVRRCDLRLGEYCVVVGAGILGLLSVQMLKLSGIRVIAVDLNDKRLGTASELGAEYTINPLKEDTGKAVENLTGGFGADAVLFTAATTSSEPLSQAFRMCKKKGRVVLVGVVGMDIKREDMYQKEIDFLISTSYGPGRYDKNYEEKGLDYPYAYVRWTENRNMSEYLRLVHNGSVRLEKLINSVYPIESVTDAFETLVKSDEKPLMVILDYGKCESEKLQAYLSHDRKVHLSTAPLKKDVINVALVGAGSFATGVHLPNIEKLKGKYNLCAVMTRTGHKAKAVAQQYGAKFATTCFDDILQDENIDLVLIATRHDSHADLALKALKAGKNVFVEKPLAINLEELTLIQEFYSDKSTSSKPLLMAGFNRRFSRYAREIKRHTDKRVNPLFIHYRMNTGFIPLDNWVHDDGGRIIGEACHIIDLMTFFTESEIESISCESLTPKNDKFAGSDNKAIVLKYKDGSVCTIEYFAVGSKDFPKEYMEVHFDEKTIVLDDYKSLKGYSIKINEISTNTSKKGHLEELEALYQALKNSGKWPIELWDMIQTTEISFEVERQICVE